MRLISFYSYSYCYNSYLKNEALDIFIDFCFFYIRTNHKKLQEIPLLLFIIIYLSIYLSQRIFISARCITPGAFSLQQNLRKHPFPPLFLSLSLSLYIKISTLIPKAPPLISLLIFDVIQPIIYITPPQLSRHPPPNKSSIKIFSK